MDALFRCENAMEQAALYIGTLTSLKGTLAEEEATFFQHMIGHAMRALEVCGDDATPEDWHAELNKCAIQCEVCIRAESGGYIEILYEALEGACTASSITQPVFDEAV